MEKGKREEKDEGGEKEDKTRREREREEQVDFNFQIKIIQVNQFADFQHFIN